MASLFQQLGMADVFHRGMADLTGMSKERGLWMSKIIHKCVVENDKEGSSILYRRTASYCHAVWPPE